MKSKQELQNVSSSSSEGGSDSELEENHKSASDAEVEGDPQAQPQTRTKFECPVDFACCAYNASGSLSSEKLSGSNTELWLIKAPASFQPESFSGKKVPLLGRETLEAGAAGTRKLYSVFSCQKELGNIHLLVQGKGSVLCGPPIRGFMNLGERFGDCNGTEGPKAIPSSPAPQIPAGLKQRFTPFGSSTPPSAGRKRSSEGEALSASLAKRVKLDLSQGEQSARRKKKKKKEKKDEESDASQVLEFEMSGSSGEVTERRKKKKKKDRERRKEEEEEITGLEMEVKEPSEIKQEVFEPEFGEEADSGRKKKKKKKDRERREEEEEKRTGFEMEIKDEPSEIKQEVFEPEFGEEVDSGRKKKKKKDRERREEEDEERTGFEMKIKEEPAEIKQEVFEPEFEEQTDSERKKKKKKKDKHRSDR